MSRLHVALIGIAAGCAPAALPSDQDSTANPSTEAPAGPGQMGDGDDDDDNGPPEPVDATLRGDWEGVVECPSGGESFFALYLPDDEDRSYEGDGVFAFTYYDEPYEIWFTAFVEHDEVFDASDEIELDLDVDDCEEVYWGGWACDRFVDVTWTPDDDRIEGDIPDFQGLGEDCWFTLEH